MKHFISLKKILSILLMLSMLLCATGCSMIEDLLDKMEDTPDDIEEENTDTENREELTEPPVTDGGKDGSVGRSDFIEGIGGVSETYRGSVSAESYRSAQEAAEAFVAEEIAGESNVEILNATSQGELSANEISKLDLPDDIQAGMTAVEALEVEYSVTNEAELASGGIMRLSADKLNTTKTVRVYVIKYETDWKYYTPAPITGNTITKSYYDSVFNAESYKNCTLNSTTTFELNMSGQESGESVSMAMSMALTQFIKHADNKIYMEQTVVLTNDGETTTTAVYAYMEEVDGEITCYIKTDPESTDWYRTYLSAIGFSSLDELTPFYDQYLDYTYFTKTSYGFALEKESAAQFMRETLSGVEGFDDVLNGSGINIDMFAEYYVSEGVLSGMRMDGEISMEMNEDGVSFSFTELVKTTTTCTDYGTTVVEKPFTE